MNFYKFPPLFLLVVLLVGCGNGLDKAEVSDGLLIFCGTAMSHPVQDIASHFEKKYNCQVAIIQGGSEDLYQSLKLSRQGDLYLSGSPVYRHKYLPEGLLTDYVYVGDNQAALIVQKGNPKNISAGIANLADPRYTVVIGNPDSCSIGIEAKKILEKKGIYKKALVNSVALVAASRNISRNMIEDGTDLALNWRATVSFVENRDRLDTLVLPDSVASKKKLLLNLLSFSKRPDLARKFMFYAVSPAGQEIFKNYGFLDAVSAQRTIQR